MCCPEWTPLTRLAWRGNNEKNVDTVEPPSVDHLGREGNPRRIPSKGGV